MSTELELKYLLPSSGLDSLMQLIPQLGELQHSEHNTLLNAYFDTADSWFRQHDMGLRSRLKQGRYEQTIKLAGSQHGAMQMRPEYNVPCDGVVPKLAAFPAEIWPARADVAQLQQHLTELFRTDFVRRSWLLRCTDGSEVELAYDQGEIRSGSYRQPIAELELELISGNALQLFALARTLLQQLPLRTGWQSKAARGYSLRAQQTVALPQHTGNTMLAQIRALQQAEACYGQTQNSAALKVASQALAALALSLSEQTRLQHLSAEATALADAVLLNAGVFGWCRYNELLLAVSEYLYQNA
ncbi:inorganic triphosphatase [Rheinheimera oceanensis]|uniref:CYTH domain-containing protein n=1 Tax=Rheinheimera oceanensis TaxID=2817449 RepID=UPI001BFDE5CB|nr:CYTH domain-containing protein [Rheinheimera oceanensis]